MKPVSVLSISLSVLLTVAARAQTHPADSTMIVEGYGKLPLVFEANQGQSDPQVKFLSRGAGYRLFLTADAAVLSLQPSVPSARRDETGRPQSARAILRMKLVNTNPKIEVSGQDELPGKSNYFIGNDPKKWQTNVQQFSKVRYEDIYPGVDLVYYGHQRELEYDFVLQPGASPEAIGLGVEGAKRLRLEHGDLVLTTPAGDVRLRSPHIYQEANGVRHQVCGRYVIKSKSEVGFEVAAYDRRRALVIDPVLAYATYLGGSSTDHFHSIAVNSVGNAYVTGDTDSIDFPTTNAIQTMPAGRLDAFVTKFNADGSSLIYSTYLGGFSDDTIYGISVDSLGNAYVAGWTFSSDFPTKNAFQSTTGGNADTFVTKINAAGSALVYSTYLGGTDTDFGRGIAVDSFGNAYVTGFTDSVDFPTKNAFQSANAGSYDCFVSKVSPGGSTLVYSTYLGGTGEEQCTSIAVNPTGYAYITGATQSTDFPTKNAVQPIFGGGLNDAFVSKFAAGGNALIYSTYLGGGKTDYGSGIAVDSAGDAYVVGLTNSFDFPTANAIQPTNAGVTDGFVTKFNPTGSALVYSTYLGGTDSDTANGIAVDSVGDAYVTGSTGANFPTVNAIQSTNHGGADAFVTEINPLGSAFVYSTYLGGPDNDSGTSIAVDSARSTYIIGSTRSEFPITPLAFQRTLATRNHGFVAKIAQQTFVSVSAAKLYFGREVIDTTSPAKNITVTNWGSITLTIKKIYIGGLDPGDFAETNTCGSALAAGASCTVAVTFTPSAKNLRQAGLGISTPDPASPDAVLLNGGGTVVSLSTSKLTFGLLAVGTTSPPQSVTLTNIGSTQLNFTGITITGTNAKDFLQTNNCGTSIAAKASCAITVRFKATATGTRKASLSISDDGGGSPQKVYLTGTGT
jgi:Beta-propeller repeat